MKLATGSLPVGLALITLLYAPAMSASCESGRDTCLAGYVWREAFPGDRVCVTRASRDRARSDNALAASRRSPNGGAYGPDTCMPGFVWREASATPTDHVCVPGDTRQQTWNENALASARRDPSCASGPVTSKRGDRTLMEHLVLTNVSKTTVLLGIAVVGLLAVAITYVADSITGGQSTLSIAPKAIASLFFILLAGVFLLTGWIDYLGEPRGGLLFSTDFVIAVTLFNPFVSVGIAASCVMAIILGRAAVRQIRASPLRFRGAFLAETGRILGFVVLIPLVICWALEVFVIVAMSGAAHH